MKLPPAHRLARTNYLPRTAAFALTFLVLCTLFEERGFAAWELAFAAFSFLVYPHLVYVHARMAPDSKQAELNNLYLDSILMGIWAAQTHFALWPTAVVLTAVTLNNAANGGAARLFWGSVCFAVAAAVWGAGTGYRFEPHTGRVVIVLSALGIFVYVSWIGTILFVQNKVLARTHHRLQDSEKQFHFVAEHPGEMISILDTQGRFLYASSSHAKHFEAHSLATGSLWFGILHPGDHERAREFLDKVATMQVRRRTRLRMDSGEGPPQYVECHASPVKDHYGNTTAVVVVTQRLDVGAVGPAPE
jgi:PAS domain S-box-containing protein